MLHLDELQMTIATSCLSALSLSSRNQPQDGSIGIWLPHDVLIRLSICAGRANVRRYQSKENAKHTLRAVQENARQGFWNGSKAPYGYAVVAAGSAARKPRSASPLARSKPKSRG